MWTISKMKTTMSLLKKHFNNWEIVMLKLRYKWGQSWIDDRYFITYSSSTRIINNFIWHTLYSIFSQNCLFPSYQTEKSQSRKICLLTVLIMELNNFKREKPSSYQYEFCNNIHPPSELNIALITVHLMSYIDVGLSNLIFPNGLCFSLPIDYYTFCFERLLRFKSNIFLGLPFIEFSFTVIQETCQLVFWYLCLDKYWWD